MTIGSCSDKRQGRATRDLASPTTPSPDARPRTQRTPGSLPSGHLCPSQQVWLPGNDLQDPATWMAPPLCQLKQMHEDLLQHYDCTDQAAAAQPATPSGAGGSAAATAVANPQPQPAGSQDNGHGKLVLPQLNCLHEALKRSQVSPPASSSSQDQPTRPRPIPSQRRLTQQLTKEWPQYKALRQLCAGTRFEEQRQLTCLRSTRPRSRTPLSA